MTTRIGFIGLGIMGKPMALNILQAGYNVTVNDLNADSVQALIEAGATSGTPADMGATCDVIITMLPASHHVEQVVLGENGILHTATPGTILIDMSSISPVASVEIANQAALRGVEMLDAPVSGGEPKAIDGTLSIMVGGKEDIFNSVKPLLDVIGASVTLVGKNGSGVTAKLANQIIVNLNIARS